jgi:2-polyprenyl-3-methyl-5-hydroxy-6-metoxy-1,4-benzoquinol methylase
MAFPRRIEAEYLDTLPEDDPAARHSRRDLRFINGLMLSASLIDKRLAPIKLPSPVRILEIGAGDGSMMLRLAQHLRGRWPQATVTLLDRQDVVSAETVAGFSRLGWRVEKRIGDVFDCLSKRKEQSYDIVIANLFLHHFSDDQLADLFARIAPSTSVVIACEPRRSTFCLAASRMLWAIGCNWVSRHDAQVSVKAGFAGNELSRLWPRISGWKIEESAGWPFSHCFLAWRNGNAA